MANSLFNALVVGTLISVVTANTVQMNIVRNEAAQAAQLQRRQLENRGLESRAETVQASLGNAVTAGLYFANISVGSPAQTLMVQIDTGSSDVWVPASTLELCSVSVQNGGGCDGGTFDYHASTSFEDVEQDGFNISYVDGSGSAGDYFQDTFSIGGATIDNFEMGLALSGTIGTGIMGIGYNNSEANVDSGNGTVYANLPFALVDQGKIPTEAYSLWLNDLDSSTGSVLFGGIDTTKFSGDLISVDVYPTSQSKQITSFTVAFTSLSATSKSGTDVLTTPSFATAAILDSGTTITLLPDALAELVFEELGATFYEKLGATIVPCALAQVNGTLDYGFGGTGGPVIKVAVSELVLPLTLSNGQTPKYTNGVEACQLGIQAAGDLPVLLGDTFLRSAYVVYDLVNNRIGLGQTNFNVTSSNIVPFASSGAPIPSATSAPNEAQVTQTASGNPRINTATATGASGVSATYNPTATGLAAASGFAAAATSSSSSKKSGARSGPEPFAWSRVVIGAACLSLMGVGGGMFTLL